MPEGDTELILAHLQGEHREDPVEGCPGCSPPQISVREPRAPRVDKQAPTGRLCGCGCGHPVSRRFLPGHDAKLKSRLLREARAGSEEAKQSLRENGWEKFL